MIRWKLNSAPDKASLREPYPPVDHPYKQKAATRMVAAASNLHYSQMLSRPCLSLCPQRILAQASVNVATLFIARIRCEQSYCAIITAIYE